MHQRAMDNDETYYLWCLRFFMEFSRLHDFRVDIVGETLQLSTLHYIIQLLANYFESMVVEKKSHVDARQWAQRFVQYSQYMYSKYSTVQYCVKRFTVCSGIVLDIQVHVKNDLSIQ